VSWSIPLRAVLAALAIHSLWGGNPVAVKLGLQAFPPLWSGLLRFSLGSVCIAAWALAARIPLRPAPGEWPALLGIGVLFTAQIALMNFGFDATAAVNGAVLIASNPLFGMLFAHLLVPGDRLRPVRVVGALFAFAGVALVLARGEPPSVSGHGDWIVLASACLLGFRLALSGRLLRRVNEIRLAFWQGVVSLPLFAAGALATETIRYANIGFAPLAGIVYQGAIVAGIAFTINFRLIRRYTPSVMMSFNFIAPVVGVLLGAAILGEAVTPALLGGMLMVAAGLILIARR